MFIWTFNIFTTFFFPAIPLKYQCLFQLFERLIVVLGPDIISIHPSFLFTSCQVNISVQFNQCFSCSQWRPLVERKQGPTWDQLINSWILDRVELIWTWTWVGLMSKMDPGSKYHRSTLSLNSWGHLKEIWKNKPVSPTHQIMGLKDVMWRSIRYMWWKASNHHLVL